MQNKEKIIQSSILSVEFSLFSGKHRIWRFMERESGRVERRPALSGGPVAHSGHVAVQACPTVHSRRGRCSPGPLSHTEYWCHVETTLQNFAGRLNLSLYFQQC